VTRLFCSFLPDMLLKDFPDPLPCQAPSYAPLVSTYPGFLESGVEEDWGGVSEKDADDVESWPEVDAEGVESWPEVDAEGSGDEFSSLLLLEFFLKQWQGVR